MGKSAVPSSVKAMLAGIVDYAGLFPPAQLSMAQAVANYARYQGGDDSWMLGRFVVPATRLQELADEASRLEITNVWQIATTGSGDHEATYKLIEEFNRTNIGRMHCDSIETKANNVADIDLIARTFPPTLSRYIEIPLGADIDEMVAAVGKAGCAAKIRTGGVTADAFPEVEKIIAFLRACARHGITFKATAGLHHAVRSMRPLTYEDNAPKALMNGFLNIIFAAAVPIDEARAVLLEESEGSFDFRAENGNWKSWEISTDKLLELRIHGFQSFGSCSFEEPTSELRSLGIIP